MRKIYSLSESLISKISAGEVIERPAYVVKELVENAIDAGADVITIHIEESGLRRITVIDNGEGMSKEDLQECFKPHTTSKIQSIEQLTGIKTLGFRGEALASIAAISNMSIKSRTSDAIGGTVVALRLGEVEHIAPVGTPVGTIVTVDSLFHSVPARKRFLKSEKTEFRHITEIIMYYALMYPHVHFILTHNKKTVFDLPKKADILERIKLLLGITLFENLIPFHFNDSYITLQGFLGKPQIASKLGQKQYIFVNNRYVVDKMISLAVKEAYGSLLPAVNTPVFILHLLLPHEVVDVNVHPRKEQVSFINSRIIFDAIKQAVTQTLAEHNLTFNLAQFKQEISAKKAETQSFSGMLLKETVLPWNRNVFGDILEKSSMLQIHNTYILTLTQDGMILIDQHAAHERILYEQFIKAFEKQRKRKEIYQLEKPLTLHLSLSEVQVFEEYSEVFTQLGFEIEHFQGTSFVIRSAPVLFKGRNIEKVIRDMLDDLTTDMGLKTVDTKSQRMLAFLSCRSAVMAGEPLTKKVWKDLLEKLQKTENNATCPHGRPTKIAITLNELHTLFKRK